MAKAYKTGLVITGDAAGGVKAIEMTREKLGRLNDTGKRSQRQMKAMRKESDKLSASIASVAHKAVAWGAAFTGIASVTAGFSKQLDSLDKIHKLNLRLGASTEALSEYSAVAEWSGTNIKQLSLAWQRQTRRIAEAAAGTGAAKDALVELNLSADELKQLRPEEQFLAIANALQGIENSGDRVRLANKIFDSEGAAAALQVINQGEEALNSMLARARELNVTVGQDQAAAVAAYNDAMADLSMAWGSVNREVAVFVATNGTETLQNMATTVAAAAESVQYLDDVAIIAAGTMAAKYVPAMLTKIKASAAAVQANRTLLASELQLAKQQHHRAVQDQAAAQRSLAAAHTMQLRAAAGTRLAVANQAVIATQNGLTAATNRYTASATLAGRATAGLKASLAFMGGPVGVAILATTGMAVYAANVDEAKIRSQKAIGPIDQLAISLREMYRVLSGGQDEYLKNNLVKGFLKRSSEELASDIEKTQKFIDKLEAVPDGGWLDGKYDAAQRDLVGQKLRLEALTEAQEQQTKAQKEADNATGEANASGAKNVIVTVKQAKAVESLKASNESLVESLQFEVDVLKHSEKEQYVQRQLRQLNAEATEEQKATVRRHSEALFEQQQALKQSNEALKKNQESVDAWAKMTDRAIERVDDAFFKLYRSSFDGFDDFKDSMVNTAKDLMAQLAYTFSKRLVINAVGSISGAGSLVGGLSSAAGAVTGSGSAGGGGGGLLGNLSSLKSLVDLGTGNLVPAWAIAGLNKLAATQNVLFNPAWAAANPEIGLATGAGSGQALSVANPANWSQSISAVAPYVSGIGGAFYGYGQSGVKGAISGAAGGYFGAKGGASFGAAIAGPVGAAVGAVLGGVLGGKLGGSLFGSGWKLKSKTLNLGYRNGKTYGYVKTKEKKKKSFFRGSKSRYRVYRFSRDSTDQLSTYFQAVKDGLKSLTGDVGLSAHYGAAEKYRSRYSRNIKYSSNNQVKKYVEQWTDRVVDGLSTSVLKSAGLDDLIAIDEKANAALMRLAGQFKSFTAITEDLNLSFNQTGAGAIRLSDRMVKIFGGMEQLQESSGFYYQNYFTDKERSTRQIAKLNGVLNEFNEEYGTSIDSRKDLRSFVESLNLTTAAGQDAYLAAMKLAPALSTLGQLTEEAVSSISQPITEQLSRIRDYSVGLLQDQQRAAASLAGVVNGLKLSDNSPLKAQAKFNLVQSDFAALQVRAETGDAEALGQIGNAAQAYINQAASFYASTGAYKDIFEDVTKVLTGLGQEFGSEDRLQSEIARLDKELLEESKKAREAADKQVLELKLLRGEVERLNAQNAAIANAQIAEAERQTRAFERNGQAVIASPL
ncbi:hypothetical protein [Aliamphritea hakodatensis]|uniref:hypothetical protein n=1 Tax=Aliamphritea hakodatensis TaxID=2895352 RepID=UPI0022FD8949|nr:hypothetical protein [Aliamphritea hakodatensis]